MLGSVGRGKGEHSPGLMAGLGFCRRFSDALAGVVVTPLPGVIPTTHNPHHHFYHPRSQCVTMQHKSVLSYVLPENRAVPLPRLCSILSTSFSFYIHANFVTPFPLATEMYLHHLCPLLARPSVYILVIVSLGHMLSDEVF